MKMMKEIIRYDPVIEKDYDIFGENGPYHYAAMEEDRYGAWVSHEDYLDLEQKMIFALAILDKMEKLGDDVDNYYKVVNL